MGRYDVTMHQPGQPSDNSFDALLAAYAAGSLPRPMHALVGAHLEISPRNRRYVSMLEGLAADDLMMEGAYSPLSDRSAALSSIFDMPASAEASPSQPERPVLPASLVRYLGHDLATMPWRTVLPGVKEFRLAEAEHGVDATLYWIRAGKRMPSHTHDGSEVTLVLQGGFTDSTGHYERGDVAVADAELDHHPVADDDIDCICFAVTDAPLRLTGPVGRLFQRLFGH